MTNSAPLDLSVSTMDKDISCFIGHKTMRCPVIICLYDLRPAEYATKTRFDVVLKGCFLLQRDLLHGQPLVFIVMVPGRSS